MRTKLIVNYHIDKLSLIYETPVGFLNSIDQTDEIFNFITDTEPMVFIFTKCYSRLQRVVKSYDLSVGYGDGITRIGCIHGEFENHIRLDIDNQFLYSGMLDLIYEFEQRYRLNFKYIKNFDVCCDANQNLPYKLHRALHSTNYEVGRNGSKKNLTNAGNQRLGLKVTENLKRIAGYEKPSTTYIYTLKPAGCRNPILFRAYNKSDEIEQSSKKYYIADAIEFDSTIYRLEVSTYWNEITQRSKLKSGFSHETIYDNMTNKYFLREFFIRYINRFFSLERNGRKLAVSEFLCLERK